MNRNIHSSEEFRYHKRNLPHYEQTGSIYFITFEAAKGFILSDMAKDIVFQSIKFHNGKKYQLCGCVIMETHVHIIIQPLMESARSMYSILQIMHSIKSYSANQIQKLLGRKGSIWLEESYDRIIRDESDYIEKMNYIINNPYKAGLVREPENYKWLFVNNSEVYINHSQAGTPVIPG